MQLNPRFQSNFTDRFKKKGGSFCEYPAVHPSPGPAMLLMKKARKEMRASPRRKILVYANITHKKISSDAYPCVLKDISETGCQVVGTPVNSVNDRFYLHSEAFTEPRLCAVAWRSRNMIGATFVVYEAPSMSLETPASATEKLGGLAP